MKVLFVCYGGGHIAMVLPVIRALRKQQPDVVITLIALTTARAAACAAGERALGYADLKHLTDAEFTEQWGPRLAAGNTHPAVSPDETNAYMGVNFWDLVQQHGMDQALELHRQAGRYSFHPIHFFRRVLAHFQPDVVVATNSPRSEQAALEAAMEQGVPTMSMLDLFAMDYDPYLKRERHADCITVMLPLVRENLVAAGVDRDRVVVTGNPAFDGLFDRKQKQAAQELRHHLGWDYLKVVLWAGIVERLPSPAEKILAGTSFAEAVEAILRRWCAQRDDVALLLRYHPNEAHLFLSDRLQSRVYVSRPLQDALHPQILASDALVVTGSTVGVEAAVARVPVLSLESSGSSGVLSYAQMGISQGVNRLSELAADLDRALWEPKRLEAVLQPGPAAPHIAQEIRRLAARRA